MSDEKKTTSDIVLKFSFPRLVLAVIAVLFSLWLVSWQTNTYPEYCEGSNDCAHYNLLIYGWIVVTHFTHVFESFFIVLFTAGLTFFTYTLWKSTHGLLSETKKLAQLASDQGEAFVRAERPYVFLEVLESGIEMFEQGEIKFAGKRMRFRMANHGKTAAFLTEIKEHYHVTEGVSDIPSPIDPMKSRGRLLPIGVVSTSSAPYKLATNLMGTAAHKMLEANSWQSRRLFFQGFVRYTDTLGKYYITGFLACFSPLGNVWVLRGDDKYNYTSEEKPETIPEWKGEV